MKQDVFDAAERKALREHRTIYVHEDTVLEDSYYITPKEKWEDNVENCELLEVFEPPEDRKSLNFEKIEDYRDLEVGDRVVVDDTDFEVVEEIRKFQIVTSAGNKFRKSDGKEWGGEGDKRITSKVDS